MNLIRKANQGGSTALYVVIGLVLVTATVILINWAQQRGEQARLEEALVAAEEKSSISSNSAITIDAEEKSDNEKSDNEKSESGQKSGESHEDQVDNAEELPTTGPNGFLDVALSGLLVLALVSFVKSTKRA